MKLLTPHLLRDEAGVDGSDTGGTSTTTKGRAIAMNDGRTVIFSEKQKIKKDYGVKDDGNVFALIDFDNGQSVEVLIDPKSKVGLELCGHGTVQKLGDAAAGAETTEDAQEAVLEVAARLNAGVFNKEREGGGGSAKGASELVLALVEVMGQTKDEVRDTLSKLSASEKMALRKVKPVAEAIEKIKASRSPSKAEAEKVKEAEALLARLQSEASANISR